MPKKVKQKQKQKQRQKQSVVVNITNPVKRTYSRRGPVAPRAPPPPPPPYIPHLIVERPNYHNSLVQNQDATKTNTLASSAASVPAPVPTSVPVSVPVNHQEHPLLTPRVIPQTPISQIISPEPSPQRTPQRIPEPSPQSLPRPQPSPQYLPPPPPSQQLPPLPPPFPRSGDIPPSRYYPTKIPDLLSMLNEKHPEFQNSPSDFSSPDDFQRNELAFEVNNDVDVPIATPGPAILQEPFESPVPVLSTPEPAIPVATPLRKRIIRVIPNPEQKEQKEEEDIPEAENVTSVKSLRDKEDYAKRKDVYNEYVLLYEKSGAMVRGIPLKSIKVLNSQKKIRAEMEQLQGSRRFTLPKINTPSSSSSK